MNEIEINGVTYVKKTIPAVTKDGIKWVLIRSYGSGVHFGILAEKRDVVQGLEVTLVESRRVHYWVGAASLSQMANEGIANAKESRVAVTVASITVSNVIETIPITMEALDNLLNQPEWKV